MEAGIHLPLHPGADAQERRIADTKAMTIPECLMNIALVGLVVLPIRGPTRSLEPASWCPSC